jgi:DNA-binding NtrC family response regulator
MTQAPIERKIKILVIDDDEDVCQFLERFLTRHNYLVRYTTEPGKAIPILKDEMFQIVILDVVMPEIDGVELLKMIRRADSDICVIILSAYPTFDNAVETFRSDAFDFITKPFETDELLKVLERAAKKRGLVSDLGRLTTEQVAKSVRRLRTIQNLSLRQLASRTGLSPSLIFQIEHAQTSPSLATITKLASALKTPVAEFFTDI